MEPMGDQASNPNGHDNVRSAKIATWLLVATAAASLLVYAAILVASEWHSPHPGKVVEALSTLWIFAIPTVLLVLSALIAKPGSFAYLISYLTLIVTLAIGVSFLVSGRFQGEHVMMLLIPMAAYWAGGVLAFFASFFQIR